MIVLQSIVLISTVCLVQCSLLGGITGGGGKGGKKGLVDGVTGEVGGLVGSAPVAGGILVNQKTSVSQKVSDETDGVENIQKAAMDTVAELTGSDIKIKTKKFIEQKSKRSKKVKTTPEPEEEEEKEDE